MRLGLPAPSHDVVTKMRVRAVVVLGLTRLVCWCTGVGEVICAHNFANDALVCDSSGLPLNLLYGWAVSVAARQDLRPDVNWNALPGQLLIDLVDKAAVGAIRSKQCNRHRCP